MSKLKLSFSGHETFPFRYTWPKKCNDELSLDKDLFRKEESLASLGVGKNMVNSIRHWGISLGLIEQNTLKEYEPTCFAKSLLSDDGWDPYLEDQATLWLLHWRLCSNPGISSTWYFAFNKLNALEFTKEHLISQLKDFALVNGTKVTQNTLNRDVDCFIKTYVSSKIAKMNMIEDTLDCPLSELNLIQETGQRGLYIFNRGPKQDIPDDILLYALVEYWNNNFIGREVVSFEDIAYSEGSPGLIFKIDEDSLAYRLERIESASKGFFRFDETSSLRQVYRKDFIDQNEFLNNYYSKKLCGI
ncbi:DUF4007 family protein [Candidatus Pacearchaeota archaeon]|nr:DUF4007 family protein [Candidatus Pacearchaeota archaeon]